MSHDRCVTCDVLAGRRNTPGGILYGDAYWSVATTLSPVLLRGHLIIMLKRHCEHLAELTADEAAAFGPLMWQTCRALSHIVRPAKVYVCSFGEDVKHIHVHVIPRPRQMPAGNLAVTLRLRLTGLLYRMGAKRVACSDAEAAALAGQLRAHLRRATAPSVG